MLGLKMESCSTETLICLVLKGLMYSSELVHRLNHKHNDLDCTQIMSQQENIFIGSVKIFLGFY